MGVTALSVLGFVVALQAPLDRALDERQAGGQPYAGVVPEGAAKNPLPPAPQTGPPQLVWTGFRLSAGRSQVFFQTTQPVAFELLPPARKSKGNVVTLLLRDTKIHLRNNARNLDTRFFSTSVAGVSARQKKKDVELRITLKGKAEPSPRAEAGPDGSQFLVLEFPLGEADAAPAVTPAAPGEAVQ
jgi:hypothetical protein